jgi:hypothetical protein
VPVRYDGGTRVVSQLENGPVDVVNLIARRDVCRIELIVVHERSTLTLTPAEHVVYAPLGNCLILLDESEKCLLHNHALQFVGDAEIACTKGVALVASIARL